MLQPPAWKRQNHKGEPINKIYVYYTTLYTKQEDPILMCRNNHMYIWVFALLSKVLFQAGGLTTLGLPGPQVWTTIPGQNITTPPIVLTLASTRFQQCLLLGWAFPIHNQTQKKPRKTNSNTGLKKTLRRRTHWILYCQRTSGDYLIIALTAPAPCPSSMMSAPMSHVT